MKRFITHFLPLSCVFFALLSGEEAFPQKKQIDEKVTFFMRAHQIPGIAAVVHLDGKSRLLTYGTKTLRSGDPVTPQTIFEIGSITKVFTSTELALKVLEGKMRLNDSIEKYIHALPAVSLLELATHTSSLPRIPPKKYQNSFSHLIEYLMRWRPRYPIGSHYQYSNLGYGLLGYALAKETGEPYFHLIHKDILAPLKMHATMIHVPPFMEHLYATGYTAAGEPAKKWKLNLWPAGGALRSTAEDMGQFLEANLGIRGPAPLLKAMAVAQQPFYQVNDTLTLGLGWQRVLLGDHLIIDKNGGTSGFSSYIGMIPTKKVGIVLLSNRAHSRITKLGRQLLLELAKEESNTP